MHTQIAGNIVLIDDDAEMALMVARLLSLENYQCQVFDNAYSGLEYLLKQQHHVVILDWGLAETSGVELLKQYRLAGGSAGVLMFTGRQDIRDKECGLDNGADDFLTKPFAAKELLARVKGLIRRPHRQQSEVADVSVDWTTQEVVSNGRRIRLMPRELALFDFLLRNEGRVYSSDALLRKVWPTCSEASGDAVRMSIMRLRSQLKAEGSAAIVRNVPRLGYTLQCPTSQ